MFGVFIKRPVLATTISLLILFLGLRAMLMLPIQQYPEMKNTVITVTTTFPGADAELMQGFITQPIQKAVSTAEGIDYITSVNSTGVSTISLYVKLNSSPDAAMTEVISKVAEVRSQLPRGINDPVTKKSTGQSFAAMYIAFYSDRASPEQITDYVTRVVQPKLSTVTGVANPEILGGQKFAVRIWLDPLRMAQLGLSADDVNTALTTNNFQAAAGTSKGAFEVIGTIASTDIKNIDAFRALVVRADGPRLTRLGDIAKVELGSETYDASVYVNGQKAVFVGVSLTPDANPLTVVSSIREMLPSIARELPPGMELKIAYDTTIFIRESIYEVVKTIGEAAVIVMVVIFFSLGSFRSVAIPLVTVPLSLVGVGVFLLALGFSINLLTLLAMVLAIGLVVDDAIVVVENIHRHIEEGRTPFEAALIGTREISGPVISMTITLAAVYAPIAFMGGLTGALFKEFAFTLAGAVIISGVIALTLSPMMCSLILRHETERGGLSGRIEATFAAIQRGYAKLLRGSMSDRPVTLVFAVIVLSSLWFLFRAIPTEMAPEEDQGAVMVSLQGPAHANLDYMDVFSRQLDKVLGGEPETDSYFTIGGYPSRNGGFAVAVLKPWSERKRTQKVLVPVFQKKIDGISGIRGSAFGLPPLPGSDGLPVQFVITSTADYPALNTLSQAVLAKAKDSGQYAFIDADLKIEDPQTVIDIDRDKAATYGVSMQQIGNALATLTGGNYVNFVDLQGRSYEVIPQVPRSFRLDPQKLGRFYISGGTGESIPLGSIVSLHSEVKPVALNQFNQQNAVTISAFPMPGVSLGTALNTLSGIADGILPKGTTYDYAGQSRQLMTEGTALIITFISALVIIYLVLAAQFESFRDPLVILVSVPLSLCGALIPLAVGVTSMNIYTQVGLVTLIGLISKHGILICEVARERQEQDGLSRLEAVEVAAGLRLRPILMTTAAMVAGLVPLMFASGAGAASRFSIAVVIVAGMSIGTLFTLFVLPVIYSFVASDHNRANIERQAREDGLSAEAKGEKEREVVL
jgi:multidrug efflux pump